MRKLCLFALPFGAAVFLAVCLLPPVVWLPVGLLCAVAALGGLPLRGAGRLRWVLIALGLGAGLLWSWGYRLLAVVPLERLDGQELSLSATVLDWPYETKIGCAVVVELRAPGGQRGRAILYAGTEYLVLQPGDRLTATARLKAANTRYGAESDYYRSRGIYLLAYVGRVEEVQRPQSPPLRHWPAWVGRSLKQSVARSFPAETAPLITALITGDKSTMPDGQYGDIRRAGLAHVIAVSGMHVSFLAGLVTVLTGSRRRLGAAVGIGLLFFFAAVAGSTPSVLRAVWMQAILLLAPLLGREEDKPTTLSAVLLLLLLANPFAVASVSLQLSFAAVAGIYLLTDPLYRRWYSRIPRKNKGLPARLGCGALTFGAGTLATTLGALVFTVPITAYYFGTVCLVAPLSNLLTLWAVSGAFLGGLVTALVGIAIPVLGVAVGFIISLPARWLLLMSRLLGRLPFAAVGLDSIYLRLWLLLAYGLLLLYLLWRGERGRPLVPVSLCTVALCAALLLTAAGRMTGRLSVSVLDVGQGLSVALYSGGRTALVDCGGSGAENPGDVAADYFQSMGLSRLDLLVLTHGHADHAGGVPRLLERLTVGRVLLPVGQEAEPLVREILALAEHRGIPVDWISDDTEVVFGASRLHIYGPLGDGGTNEEGLSVLCSSGAFDGLVTGDMNGVVEQRLVKYGGLPDLELLVVGHHGSRYASSAALLEATMPEYAVISVGYNSYGHPAAQTLERLAAAGCAVYRTDLMGTVTIIANA